MRFVTDLGKGILGQADSYDLWNEIISYIPDQVLLKPDVKILNVSFGHGTEADIIANRMLALGRTKDEVKSSIYLIDKYRVFTNRAVRKGYTNVITADFLDWNPNMKFDVVIGNPPYNWSSDDGKQRKNNRENLWTRFVTKSFEEMVAPDGYVSMVVPKTWMSPSRDFGKTIILQDYFAANTTIALNIDECARHFNVGSSFSYFVVKKDAQKGTNTQLISTEGVSQIDLTSDIWKMGIPTLLDPKILSVISKFYANSKPFKWERQYEGQVDEILDSGTYSVFHTPASVGKTFSNTASYLHTRKKVMISLSGKYVPYYDSGNCSPSGMIVCLLLNSNETLDAAKSVFDSKLYRLIVDKLFRYNGWINGNVLKKLPALDLTKVWTAQDIYQHFKLTSEEIEYVEANA